MFEKLCAIYDGTEEREKCNILNEFFNLKFTSNSQTMSEFISVVENMSFRLKRLGQDLDEQIVISKILSAIPEKYKYFISAWESTPEENRSLKTLKNRLLAEEGMWKWKNHWSLKRRKKIKNISALIVAKSVILQSFAKDNKDVKFVKRITM
jgi:hypothetical protein